MKRIYVCSRLRGPDGQPDPKNIARAKRLMREVFRAGHAPFAPHLLYPQVLSEDPADLDISFKANFAYLDVSDEIWVDAAGILACSAGMQLEVERAQNGFAKVIFNPEEWARVP